jgi:ribonuclease HI
MELLAVITGLEALKAENCIVTVYTDSKYVADAVEKGWIRSWEQKRFAGKKNSDLWIRFLKIYRKHTVNFVWVKGHASVTENERCDSLAVEASYGENLPDDEGYCPE